MPGAGTGMLSAVDDDGDGPDRVLDGLALYRTSTEVRK